MKNIKKKFILNIYFIFFFSIICFSIVYASRMETEKWSFEFKNCTISDALIRITETTGIDVYTNKRIKKKLSKSYDASTIDQIINDIFRKENYAMVWYYSENNLDSVNIRVFESSGSDNNFHQDKSFRKTSAKGSATRKKVDYKSANDKWRAGNDNLKNRDSKSEKLSTIGEQPLSNDLGRGLQKYGANKGSVKTLAPSNDKPETGIYNSSIETTKKDTASPPVPNKQLSLESPPMPPSIKN